MSACNVIICLMMAYAVPVSIWCLVLDNRNQQLQGWRERSEKEVDYVKEKCPAEWRTISMALYTAEDLFGEDFS